MLLIAHQVHDRGGMERALSELIRRASDDIAFHVMSVVLQDDLQPLVDWIRVRVPLRPFPVLMASFWAATAGIAHRVDTDLVHTMGAITSVHADLASVQFCHAAFQALPDVVGNEEVALLNRANKTIVRPMALNAERWCYRPPHTRRFAPASSGVEAELAQFYPAVPSTVIPNAADHDRFHPDPDLRASVRGTLGVTDDTTIVLFLGGDWRRKGLAVTIEGVAAARRSGAANVALWVVGAGDVERYRASALALDDAPWCTFHGFSHQPERFLAAADVFVSATSYEAFPLAALEAAACGLPVIATNVNGIAELIHDRREGLIVSRDASSIGSAITMLSQDRALRERMGLAARQSASRYTWDSAARTTLDAYDALLRSA